MIDHFSFSVNDYEQSLTFYDETLGLLGYKRNYTIDIPEHGVKTAGYGVEDKPSFWISPIGNEKESIGQARGVHVAFLAPNKESVDAWYAKCVELGATDNGEPGPRPEYHPGYYGAFVVDSNGWRIEACFHEYTT